MKKNMNKEDQIDPINEEKEKKEFRQFFTKDVNDQIREMTMKEMEEVLKAMVGSRQFTAIMKYSSSRTPIVENMLRVTNPSKEPHIVSWAQGCLNGLCDLENYVISLNAPKEEE